MAKLLFLFHVFNCLYGCLKSNEYFLDTCCSLNENERIALSCGLNEKIRLNLIEIFYNSDSYCSSEESCCKYRTKCSRRITKYSSLHCDGENSCWIDKSCLKIYKSCSNIYGLYGQYITISYSCLPTIDTDSNHFLNETYFNDQSIPFIVKLLTSEHPKPSHSSIIKEKHFSFNHLKSSPIFLIAIIFTFIFLMLFTYWLAHLIGKKICRKTHSRINDKTSLISQKMIIKHDNDQKIKVQSNYSSLPQTRIYPTKSIYQYQQPSYYNRKSLLIPYSYSPYRQYINVQHDPITGQITSRTFNSYFNYY